VARGEEGFGFALDGAREGEPAGGLGGCFEAGDGALEDECARIAYAIDAVAHSHDALASRERVFGATRGGGRLADRVEHVEHRTRGTAMELWPFSAPIAATTAETVSDAVDATTRAANVEAFIRGRSP